MIFFLKDPDHPIAGHAQVIKWDTSLDKPVMRDLWTGDIIKLVIKKKW